MIQRLPYMTLAVVISTACAVQLASAQQPPPPAAKKNYRQFLSITDDTGASTGWDPVGTWDVLR